jgi:hypothetical protein
MATRFVFKFFGSIGPAGSIVGLVEKMCTALYPYAYNYGDESQTETQVDKDLRSLREEYIVEIFKIKNKFQKNAGGENGKEKKDEAFRALITVIKTYIEKMTRMEKNKYMRERLFYQRENQIVLYEEANKKYHECEDEVKDNLIKMAKTICTPNEEEFTNYLSSFQIDYTDVGIVGDISKRITKLQAQEYADHWTKLQTDHNAELNRLERLKNEGSSISETDEAKIATLLEMDADQTNLYIKDRLFIETGEDVEDIFLALKFYQIM